MTQTENKKPPLPAKGDQQQRPQNHPTLVYLCGGGGRNNGKIRSSVAEGLSWTCFVRTSIGPSGKDEDFTECCHAITSSSVFIFVLDNESVFDLHCLSLLGTAIAFDIPVVGIREAGYALPYEVPKLFGQTEIVDRSRAFEYKMNSKNLPAVTTLAAALKVLFTQSVIYHERIKHKCVREITDMLVGVSGRRNVTPQRLLEQQNDAFFNNHSDSLSNETNNNEHTQQQGEVEITKFPQQITIREGISRRTPEQRKPLGPSPPNKMRTIVRKNSKKNMIVKKNNNNGKLKIQIHSPDPDFSSAAATTTPTGTRLSESLNQTKPRSHTTEGGMTETSGELMGVGAGSFHKLRRNSSLPCIKTNYMVTSEEKRSRPVIYQFPISPRLQKRLSSSASDLNIDLDDDKFHLSRTCSPIDLRSEDGTLFVA